MAFFNLIVYGWITLAIITFLSLVLFKIKAPYGRHVSDQWGKMIDNHWGWFWMELPALLIVPFLVISGPAEKSWLTWLLVGLWVLHYFYRTLIFPFRLKTKGKKMPLAIVFSALFFNSINGFLIGYFLGFLNNNNVAEVSPNIVIGLILFFTGMYINRSADKRLIKLRARQEGYQIPKGWLFNFISCPNHFGEITEWIGFAVLAWNLPAAGFAIWTFCNLVPRALNHHEWYLLHFKNYPVKRNAVIPFLW